MPVIGPSYIVKNVQLNFLISVIPVYPGVISVNLVISVIRFTVYIPIRQLVPIWSRHKKLTKSLKQSKQSLIKLSGYDQYGSHNHLWFPKGPVGMMWSLTTYHLTSNVQGVRINITRSNFLNYETWLKKVFKKNYPFVVFVCTMPYTDEKLLLLPLTDWRTL